MEWSQSLRLLHSSRGCSQDSSRVPKRRRASIAFGGHLRGSLFRYFLLSALLLFVILSAPVVEGQSSGPANAYRRAMLYSVR